MGYRAMFIVGFAVGFVVGTRAGRERYEQMVKYARQTADSPAVQQATRTITAKTTELGKTAASKTTELTKTAAARVPKIVESAKNKASDRMPSRGGSSDDAATVNGARPTADTDGTAPRS
jgi:cell division septum initiation protein DivIVA